MLAIWKRELQNYFLTPIGYVFMGFFLLVSGVFFFQGNIYSQSGDIANLLYQMSSIFMFLVPVLTMRLMSEERKNKSDQLLLTSPVSLNSIILGKFLAAATMLALTLFVSLFYVLVIGVYGKLTVGKTICAYLGYMFMGCSYIAIGLLMSTICESQVAAAVSTLGINLMLQFLEFMAPQLNVPYLPFLPSMFSWLSINSRFEQFVTGVFSVSSVVYFLSYTAMLLFLSVRVVEKRRWSEG